MATGAKIKKWILMKKQIQGLLWEQRSKDEAKEVTVKTSVKTSERSKFMPQGIIQQHRGPFKEINGTSHRSSHSNCSASAVLAKAQGKEELISRFVSMAFV